MAQLLVRDLDQKVVDRLKKHAKAEGKSLQSEVKNILEEASHRVDRETFFKGAQTIRLSLRGKKLSSSAKLIRQDRDR
jgi:plasmid stability protein